MCLGGFDSVLYHILHVTKKKCFYIVTVVHCQFNVNMTSNQSGMFADLKILHTVSSASHITL